MSTKSEKLIEKWFGVVVLIAFAVLIAWDFTAISNKLTAVVVGIVIALALVGLTKLSGLKLGWPKK